MSAPGGDDAELTPEQILALASGLVSASSPGVLQSLSITPEQVAEWANALSPSSGEVAAEAAESEESEAAKALMAGARRKMVSIVCADCIRNGRVRQRDEVGEVKDSPNGPLLLLRYPGTDVAMMVPFKKLTGERAEPLKGNYVRRLVSEDKWTRQEFHCDRHGERTATRQAIVDLVDLYRSKGGGKLRRLVI